MWWLWNKKKVREEVVEPYWTKVNLEFREGPFVHRCDVDGVSSILFRLRGEALWAISPECMEWLNGCRGRYEHVFIWPKHNGPKPSFRPHSITTENPQGFLAYKALGVQFKFTEADEAMRFKLTWR